MSAKGASREISVGLMNSSPSCSLTNSRTRGTIFRGTRLCAIIICWNRGNFEYGLGGEKSSSRIKGFHLS